MVFGKLMMIAMAVMVSMTFSACSGSGSGSDGDDDDIVASSGKKPAKGVYRVDMTFSDNAGDSKTNLLFSAHDENIKRCKIYENGKMVSADGSYLLSEPRNTSIYSEDNCMYFGMQGTVSAKNTGEKIKSEVTITLTGYCNDKKIKSQKIVIPAGISYATLVFLLEDNQVADPIFY